MTVHMRLFGPDGQLMYRSPEKSGRGETDEVGAPRGDYYNFKNIAQNMLGGERYTVVFVVKCPHTESTRARIPIFSPVLDNYAIDDFGNEIYNVYQYSAKHHALTMPMPEGEGETDL